MANILILSSSGVVSLLLARHEPTYFTSSIWTFIILTTAIFTARFIYHTLIYPHLLSPLRHLPTVPGANWLTGHFLETFYSPSGRPQLQWASTIPHDAGLIRYFGMFNAERIIPISTKTLSEALHSKSYTFIKPNFLRNRIGRILGIRGILFAEGDEHRHQRKLLLPAFSHAHIKNLMPKFWGTSLKLVAKITAIVDEADGAVPVIEMSRWCSLATLDIIGSAGFGCDFRALATSSQAESGSELVRAYQTLFVPTGAAMLMYIARVLLPIWFFLALPMRRTREVKKASETVRRISREIIDAKKAELAEKKGAEQDILSVMLNSGDYEGADGISVMQDQMMTFLAAGHETTATAMLWGLHLLSLRENHGVQARLREEIRAAFPHGVPESVSYEKIEGLRYLRNVISEVLRYYPPVPLTVRHAAEDTTLGGQFVPKGTHLAIVPWAINRSKELWGEDADVFRPDRWDESQGESNYAFMTFLAGPRGCIGSVFAKIEFKCLLAALIGRFSFEEAIEGRKIEIKGGITSKPGGGIPLKVSTVPGW